MSFFSLHKFTCIEKTLLLLLKAQSSEVIMLKALPRDITYVSHLTSSKKGRKKRKKCEA